MGEWIEQKTDRWGSGSMCEQETDRWESGLASPPFLRCVCLRCVLRAPLLPCLLLYAHAATTCLASCVAAHPRLPAPVPYPNHLLCLRLVASAHSSSPLPHGPIAPSAAPVAIRMV